MSQISKLKPIKTIHLAFCAAILTLAAVSAITVKNNIYFDVALNQNNGLYPLFPILAIIVTVVGIFLFNKQIAAIDNAETFDSKFMKYQTAFLVRCAFLEGGALMNVVGFLMTANTVFLIAAAIPFLYLVRSRPTKDQIVEDLNLQYPDTEIE
ncbi:putative membrane protein (GlpM family) [Pedobacter sp. UYP24]